VSNISLAGDCRAMVALHFGMNSDFGSFLQNIKIPIAKTILMWYNKSN
jgi:hypothetical protein